MYTNADITAANRLVRRSTLILAAFLAVMLAAYVAAIIAGKQLLMLAVLQLAFWCAAIYAAVCLCPRLLYRRFLRDMQAGLRRECVCTILSVDPKIQYQDGANVHALEVRLDDGDTRIFYLNTSKSDAFPPAGTHLRLTGWGRHVVAWEEMPG